MRPFNRKRKSKLDPFIYFIFEKLDDKWSLQQILDALNRKFDLNIKARSTIQRKVKVFINGK